MPTIVEIIQECLDAAAAQGTEPILVWSEVLTLINNGVRARARSVAHRAKGRIALADKFECLSDDCFEEAHRVLP